MHGGPKMGGLGLINSLIWKVPQMPQFKILLVPGHNFFPCVNSISSPIRGQKGPPGLYSVSSNKS